MKIKFLFYTSLMIRNLDKLLVIDANIQNFVVLFFDLFLNNFTFDAYPMHCIVLMKQSVRVRKKKTVSGF